MTLRQIVWMSEGRSEELRDTIEVFAKITWRQTSAIMAQLHNVQCTKRHQLIPFNRFDPYERNETSGGRLTSGMLLTKQNMAAFIAAMTTGRDGKQRIARLPTYEDPRKRPGTVTELLGPAPDHNAN